MNRDYGLPAPHVVRAAAGSLRALAPQLAALGIGTDRVRHPKLAECLMALSDLSVQAADRMADLARHLDALDMPTVLIPVEWLDEDSEPTRDDGKR